MKKIEPSLILQSAIINLIQSKIKIYLIIFSTYPFYWPTIILILIKSTKIQKSLICMRFKISCVISITNWAIIRYNYTCTSNFSLVISSRKM